MLRLVALASLAGCFYAPYSYTSPSAAFTGKRVEVGCLDLALALTDDPKATGPVVEYTFGNHCYGATAVDLASVSVVGVYSGDRRLEFHAYDPHHELHPARLDALWSGSEAIEYLGDREPMAPAPATVCVDVGRINGGNAARWICVGAVDLGVEAP